VNEWTDAIPLVNSVLLIVLCVLMLRKDKA